MNRPSNAEKPAHWTVRDAARAVTWGLLLWGAAAATAAMLAGRATAAMFVQAAIAEWGTAHMGIAWSDRTDLPASFRGIARRAAVGAACGIGVAGMAVAAALWARTAVLAGGPRSLNVLVVGLLLATLAAVRDELLLRGVVLRVAHDLLPLWAALLACAGAGACARIGVDGQMSLAVAFDALRGAALGALWVRDRGAWMALGANVGWSWMADSLARGGAFDVRYGTDPASDGPTLAVLAVATLAAVVVTMGRPRRRGLL